MKSIDDEKKAEDTRFRTDARYIIRHGVYEDRGRRSSMEDAYAINDSFTELTDGHMAPGALSIE
jgi:hypothetical protein